MGTRDDNAGRDRDAAHASTAISSPGVPVPPAPSGKADAFIGRTIAERYHVQSLLGRGGMGSVYLSEHVQLRKRVALKVLSENLKEQPDLVQRFLKEARAAAQIGHPNIVDIFDLGELPEGGAYIAMALLEGNDLQQELDRSGPLPAARASAIVAEICRALAAAHGKGIVHRDMKPGNVFLARDSEGLEQVKVLDFGIAQIQEPSGEEARLTQTGAIIGTPSFMSPEQARGERADHRADIYSVGCIFYDLVTGRVPFEADTLVGVITKHLFEDPTPPSVKRPDLGIPPELDALIVRAMAKRAEDRFQTMKEFWTAIEALSGAASTWPDATSGRYNRLTPAPAPRTRATPSTRSNTLLFVGSALTVVLAGSISAYLLTHRAQPTVVATPPVIAPVNEVTIEIRTTPPGAIVWSGDKQLGTTPLRMTRPRSSDELPLRIASDGNVEESVPVTLDRDRLVELRLQPQPATHVEPHLAVTPPPPKTPHDAPERVRPKAVKAGRDGQLKNPFAQ